MPPELINRCGVYPHIDSGELFPLIFELTSEVKRVMGVDLYHHHFYNEKQLLFPIATGGLIHTVAETKLFQRLFTVHQLGLARFYPLPNPHNRGEHSIYLAINVVRSLQALYDKDNDLLFTKLRDDLIKEDLYQPKMSNEDILNTSCDLAVLAAMMHDLATPAGGDTFKYLLGLSEEDDLEWLFFNSDNLHQEEKNELKDIFTNQGLSEKHLRYVIECVQGKSNTLIGQMLSPSSKDQLDFDRTAYTLLDSQAATMLDASEVPTILLPKRLRSEDDKLILARLKSGVHALTNTFAAVLHLSPLDVPTGDAYPLVPTNIIDCAEDYCLKNGFGLVCERPDKLAWIAAYRIWMTGLHYAGSQMLGLEWELQQHLKKLMERGIGTSLLNRQTLLNLTDDELFQALGELNDPVLTGILTRNAITTGSSLFSGRLIDDNMDVGEKYLAVFPLKIKAGLDSLVVENGSIVSLQQWIENNPDKLASKAALEGMEKFRGKKVAIYKRS